MKPKEIVMILIFLSSCVSHNKDETNALLNENSVVTAVEHLKTGIINADKDLLDRITAEQLVYGHSNGTVQNKSEFIKEIISLQPNDYITIDLTDQTITISGETAVVRHIYSAKYVSNGDTANLKIGNMLIWQIQDGKWKLLARQAYSL